MTCWFPILARPNQSFAATRSVAGAPVSRPFLDGMGHRQRGDIMWQPILRVPEQIGGYVIHQEIIIPKIYLKKYLVQERFQHTFIKAAKGSGRCSVTVIIERQSISERDNWIQQWAGRKEMPRREQPYSRYRFRRYLHMSRVEIMSC